MLEQNQPQEIVCVCPTGHRLRGSLALMGETIVCPRCQAQFVFGRNEKHVTDTAVMRILSDTTGGAVGDSPVASADGSTSSRVPVTRPCGRCGLAIVESATVCSHCNLYAGALPAYLQQMHGNTAQN